MAFPLERKIHPKINHAEPEDEITKEEEEESFCYAIQLPERVQAPSSLRLILQPRLAPMMMDRILRLLTSHSVLHSSLAAANEDENGGSDFQRWILHDWTDEHCLKLLKNRYRAIPDDGKQCCGSTSQLDVIMMTEIPGGKERSEQEFMALATGAGFSGIRYECFVCNFWVMEFFK
ncbi:hypothetical protein PRUPE_2G199000 [Prunus persica]|uniref:O-methyltransferase C-terminal domain-containing protein n=1 Tax=Prunus persica TaxID=3760 RepID=A0A251QIF5_PRUPE|nr:hypothetical protein PRUPE_2G199000 [Prunus persica]